MRFKVVIIILDFVILALALVSGFFSLNLNCYFCPRVLIYAQFLDTVIYGLLLLIFFMCVSDMAKESIPLRMQLTANFSAAILYFVATAIYIFLFFKSEPAVFRMSFCPALGILHLSVGLMFLYRDKLTRLT